MPLSDAEKQAYARVGLNIMQLWAIELRHSTFGSHVRFVNYFSDINHTLEASAPVQAGQSVLFTALAFQFKEPTLSDEAVENLSAQVDGVTGVLQPYLAAANQTVEPIEATIRELLYDVATSTVLHAPSVWHLRVVRSKETMESVLIEMGRRNSANQTFPNMFYTPATNPGLLS